MEKTPEQRLEALLKQRGDVLDKIKDAGVTDIADTAQLSLIDAQITSTKAEINQALIAEQERVTREREAAERAAAAQAELDAAAAAAAQAEIEPQAAP